MITLKLASYSQEEVKILANLLEQLQPNLQSAYCASNLDCKCCPVRHICIDLAQATIYAEEYQPTR